jgi:hypothetical protein
MGDRLRTLLDELTSDPGVTIQAYPERLAAIAAEIPHSVRIIPAALGEPLDDFNCVMYALGIVGALEYPCRPFGEYYADTAFLRSLIDAGELRPCEPSSGALVTWSSALGLQHVGVLIAPGRATSKWGRGHLCEHGLLEVPLSMGDRLAFYTLSMEPGDVLNRLAEFHHWTRR